MELRRVNDYDLITVYVCQTLYDQFSKKKKKNKGREQPSHSHQAVGNHKQHLRGCTMNLKM